MALCCTLIMLQAQHAGLLTRPELAQLDTPLRGLVTAALEAGALPKAEQLLLDALANKPASPEMLTLAGIVFLADHQPLNAAIAFKKADKLRPLAEPDRFSLSMAYIAMKRGDWARAELLRLSKTQADNPLYLYWLARLDYDDQRFGDAVDKLNKVIAAQPANAKAHDNLGLNLEALGRLEEALESYRKATRFNALEHEPSPWPPLNLGTLALRLRYLPEARRVLEEAARFDPASAEAHYRLGVLCEQEARPDNAIEELRRAAQLDAHYASPWWALARVLRRNGRAAEADRALVEFKNRKSFGDPAKP